MILGSELGRYAIGELPGTSAAVAGVIFDVAVQLIPGIAVGETVPVRMIGGTAFVRPRRTMAPGTTFVVGTSIIPGVAQVGHEVTVTQSDGRARIVTIFGATDEELADDAFMMGVVLGDWDPYLVKQREAA